MFLSYDIGDNVQSQSKTNKTLANFLMSQNNKTDWPWTSQDLKRHTPLLKSVKHETQTVFLVCKVNQGVILFSCKLCTFFIEHLWATASVKIEMQVKIMTSK